MTIKLIYEFSDFSGRVKSPESCQKICFKGNIFFVFLSSVHIRTCPKTS
ncbi:hypothetical protein LBBP_03077 [Leptospira borgpetersenii serovar Ballum]|uniref:Uncharacterized protein n=1 Tax=Leptospira borgpetersenii serovar Ballum TaxID=280505 RepID=A0A0S2IUG6_LEPBO|nr:hypothetical protein LBBP_03077 [Leptospira borgpetersenii serovar Ballum]